MEQYISKFALVAEIERIKKEGYYDIHDEYDGYVRNALDKVLSFINTLEVKEVDLGKVFNDEYSKFSNDTDAMDYAFPIDLADFKDFAKHFFDLGVSVSNKAQKECMI